MVVSLDVTHPTRGPQGSRPIVPSVAGMVASVNKLLGQWPAIIQIQSRGRKEEIVNLDLMLKRHFHRWKS
jgi:hypothetical protein